MNAGVSRSKRRLGVVVNLASLVLVVLLFAGGVHLGWSPVIIIAVEVMAVAVVLVSFSLTFWRTRLWHLVHRKYRELDERQAQVVYDATSRSYAVFSVVCLLIIFALALLDSGVGSSGMIALASLIYLSHILPATFVAWTEKEV